MSVDTSARPAAAMPPPVRLNQKEQIGARLEEHRRARRDQVKAHTFADPNDSDLDPGARMRVLSAAKLTISEIDQALLRLDDGSYGFCVGCTQPIPQERLLAVPYARYCVPCAQRQFADIDAPTSEAPELRLQSR